MPNRIYPLPAPRKRLAGWLILPGPQRSEGWARTHRNRLRSTHHRCAVWADMPACLAVCV